MTSKEATKRFRAADELYRNGQYQDALDHLDLLNEQFPHKKNIMFPRARCLNKLGRTEEAIMLCDEIIERFAYGKAVELRNQISKRDRKSKQPASSAAPAAFDVEQQLGADDIFDFDIPVDSPFRKAPAAKTSRSSTRLFLVVGIALVSFVGALVGLIYIQRGGTVQFEPVERTEEAPSEVVTEEIAPTTPETSSEEPQEITYSIGWRIALIVVILFLFPVANLYLTLLFTGKLPHPDFAGNLVNVVSMIILVGFVSLVPIIGWIIALYILHRTYELGFVGGLIFLGLTIVLGGVTVLLVFGVFLVGLPTSDLLENAEVEWEALEEELGDEFAEGEIPSAYIAVDGLPDDWANIPIFLTPWKDPYSEPDYDVQTVKLARDTSNLYVFLDLGTDIRERFRSEFRGSAASFYGRIGELTVEGEDDSVNLELTTGALDDGAGGAIATTDCQVSLYGSSLASGSANFLILFREYPEYFGIGDNMLELKIPLEASGLAPPPSATVRFVQ